MPYKDPVKRAQCQKECQKRYYEKNKKAQIDRNKRVRARNRELWETFKSNLSCVLCGESHPATLDFHHLVSSPANKKISRLTADGLYKQAIKEIESKCVVLCSNCHRKHHHEQRKSPA